MKKLNALVLIDGSSLLSTSFFATLSKDYYMAKTEEAKEKALSKLLTTASGITTNGVYGMMKTFENLIKKVNPSHIAVAWDVTRDTIRREWFEEYKGNRGEILPQLKDQFALAWDVLEAMNIPQFKSTRYEADDIIGTLAKKYCTEIPVYIVSKDQDQLQLINENTRMWLMTSTAADRYKELEIDTKLFSIPESVFEYSLYNFPELYGINDKDKEGNKIFMPFGITPSQFVDYLAIAGDASDNIPGVKGIGDKSVIPLLQEFKTLDGIYEYIESHSEKELKEFFKELGIRSPLKNLVEQKENAYLSQKLATIICDMPGFEKLTLDELGLNIDQDGRKEIYEILEFKSLLK